MSQQQSPVSPPKRQQSKFGKLFNNLGKSASKGMKRVGKNMGKGLVKTKQLMAERVLKIEPSPQQPEIISALERLKTTKNEIYAISTIVRSLYEARINEAHYMVQLAQKLSNVKATKNDPFGLYVTQMGKGFSQLESVQSEHLKRMEEELVIPLEKFRDVDVEEVQKLKLKYKSAKTHYDITLKGLQRAKEKGDTGKIAVAEQKKELALSDLEAVRQQFKLHVNNLEQKKQVNLLGCLESYWSSYTSYASAQSQVLQKHNISKIEWKGNNNQEENESKESLDSQTQESESLNKVKIEESEEKQKEQKEDIQDNEEEEEESQEFIPIENQ